MDCRRLYIWFYITGIVLLVSVSYVSFFSVSLLILLIFSSKSFLYHTKQNKLSFQVLLHGAIPQSTYYLGPTTRNLEIGNLVPVTTYTITLDSYIPGELENLTPGQLRTATVPAPVVNATIYSKSGTKLFLSWQRNEVNQIWSTPSDASYLITRLPSELSGLKEVLVHTNLYEDPELTPATKYMYKIETIIAGLTSEPVYISGYTLPIKIINEKKQHLSAIYARKIELGRKVTRRT